MRLARIRAISQVLNFVLLYFGIGFPVHAEDLTIFDSRRPVALSASETTYRDFYINGGIEHGVKKDMILTVSRRLTLYDSYRANSPKELMVEVAKVKIIFAQKGLSVARHYEEFSRSERTILEHDFIMVGDKVDLSTAQMESKTKKKSAKRKKTDETTVAKAEATAPASADLASEAPMGPTPPPANPEPAPLNSLQ